MISYVARTLEITVPLLKHPSENENDSEVQYQNKDASFQTAIDENDDKKDTFETTKIRDVNRVLRRLV